MPIDKSLDLQKQLELKSISSDAEDWGNQFVKHLELEYTSAASELPAGASFADFRRAMMSAVITVLGESGAKPEETARLLKETMSRFLSTDRNVEWTSERNARRIELIDKLIQANLSIEEAAELDRLTGNMRAQYDIEEMIPLEGARRLHRRLLDIDGSESTPN
jgi:hypothetical protein